MSKNAIHAVKSSGYKIPKKERFYYEDEEITVGIKKSPKEPKRRPIRNLTKAWYEHGNHFEDVEDFYGK